jgi:signal transduction histidine kinase
MPNLFADKDIARSLVESLPTSAGVWYVHPLSGFFNDGVTELTGFTNEDLQKSRLFWLRHVHARDRARVFAAWKELQTKATTIDCEYRFLPKGRQEEIWIKDISRSFELADGKIGGIISVYSDVSPGREARIGMPKTDGELVRVIRGLAHDLRSHLHTIGGAVELARITGPKSLRSDDITKAAEEINKLVEEFKDYFIPPVPQLSRARIESIIEDVVVRAEDQFQRRGISLELVHQGDLPHLWLDVKQVTKAVDSLVELLVTLLSEGGELCIETYKVAGDREDLVEIRMSGRSFRPLEVDPQEVFRPFPELQQFKAGLGIALAREIVLRNRGRIFFQRVEPRLIVLVISLNGRRVGASRP